MSTLAVVLGVLASICSISSFAPQAWKIIRTRDTKNLSGPMYALTVVGFALWAGYGISLGSWPVIVTNSVCFLLAAFILVMILLPRSEKSRVAETLDPKAGKSRAV